MYLYVHFHPFYLGIFAVESLTLVKLRELIAGDSNIPSIDLTNTPCRLRLNQLCQIDRT